MRASTTLRCGGASGLPLDVLQRVPGHADIATTIRFYTSATERNAEAIRAAIAKSGLSGEVQDTPGTRGAVSAG